MSSATGTVAGGTVTTDTGPATVIVLTWRSNGKPAGVFTSDADMRRWLNAGGYASGWLYHRTTVPLNPTR